MHNFKLIENAEDSLLHAMGHVKPVNNSETGDWKRVIVDFAHVVELLFKEKLRRIHPALVFKNIDKIPFFESHTVGSEQAFKRLQNIGGMKFSEDDINAINTARKKRNEIEHYEFSITNQEAKVVVGQILSFILRFANDDLGLDWKSNYLNDKNWNLLIGYTEFFESLLETANKKITSESLEVIDCTLCSYDTFDIGNGVCVLCGHTEDVLFCESCDGPYLYSSVDYDEAGLCCRCEYEDGYAAANFEKY